MSSKKWKKQKITREELGNEEKKQEEIKQEDVKQDEIKTKKSIFVNFSEFVFTLVMFDLIYFVSERCFSTFLKTIFVPLVFFWKKRAEKNSARRRWTCQPPQLGVGTRRPSLPVSRSNPVTPLPFRVKWCFWSTKKNSWSGPLQPRKTKFASGAPPGSSPAWCGSAFCKPGLVGWKTALPRSVSLGVRPPALTIWGILFTLRGAGSFSFVLCVVSVWTCRLTWSHSITNKKTALTWLSGSSAQGSALLAQRGTSSDASIPPLQCVQEENGTLPCALLSTQSWLAARSGILRQAGGRWRRLCLAPPWDPAPSCRIANVKAAISPPLSAKRRLKTHFRKHSPVWIGPFLEGIQSLLVKCNTLFRDVCSVRDRTRWSSLKWLRGGVLFLFQEHQVRVEK